MDETSRALTASRAPYMRSGIVTLLCVLGSLAMAYSAFGAFTPALAIEAYLVVALIAGLLIPAGGKSGAYRLLWTMRNVALAVLAATVAVDIVYCVLDVVGFGVIRQ